MNGFHLSSEKSWRGGEQQIAYLIEELRKAGIENHVLCRANTPFETYCKEQQIPFRAAAFANQFDLSTALKLKEYCRDAQIDLIHAHSSHSHAFCIWAALLDNKTPVILSRRVDFPVSNNWLSKLKYRHPVIKKVICVSEKVKEIVAPALRSPKLATTVYDGINLDRFANSRNTGKLHGEFGVPNTRSLSGTLLQSLQQKDYFTFVNTVALLVEAGIRAHFFIIGKGNQDGEIREFIGKKSFDSSILH